MQPCNVCKGLSERPCIICGCKKKKGRFFPKKKVLTAQEILVRDGRREAIMQLDRFSRSSLKHGNCSTQSEYMDQRIKEHRVFAQSLWQESQGKTLLFLAKKHDLTLNQVKQIVATALMQQLEKAPNTLRRPTPCVPKKMTEEEIAEIRRIRDTPKPPKPGTFANVEDEWN